MKGDAVLLFLLALAAFSGPEPRAPRAPQSPAPSGRRNPFPPQPEPSDADLLTPPWDMSYPRYADLLWMSYAEHPDREGPRLTPADHLGAGLRALTDFERWALAPFVPAAALQQPVNVAAQQDRYHRWWLSIMSTLLGAQQLDVGRKLYEQARDFYRGKH